MPRPRCSRLETERKPKRWSDGIETRPRRSKNASRPSRDRDVRDRDYNPDIYGEL